MIITTFPFLLSCHVTLVIIVLNIIQSEFSMRGVRFISFPNIFFAGQCSQGSSFRTKYIVE